MQEERFRTASKTGNRTNVTENTGRSINWSYDGIYRLTNETISNAPSKVNGSASYGLDPVGNRLSTTSTISGINSGSLSFNPDDQELIESYDADGNTTATGGKNFAYDSEDRLKSMNGGAVTITYDGDGNRVAKTVNGATTHYLVDDLNPTGLPQVVEETGATQRVYTYGLQRISQYQFINDAWTPSFYGYDGMRSVRQLTNTAGATTDTYEYDAFGNELNSIGTTPNEFLYRGEQYDSDLGLYYQRARYYNPLTGRFLSRDPQTGIPRDPSSQHKYSYSEGNPVNLVDPSGNAAIVEFLLLQFRPSPIVPVIRFNCSQIERVLGPASQLLPFCEPNCPNCSIEVKCRGIEYHHLGWLGAQHCDAEVTDSSGTDHSLSAGPDPPNNPLNATLNAWDTAPPPGPFTGSTVFKDPNNCPLANCLISATDRYHNSANRPHYDGIHGPNSSISRRIERLLSDSYLRHAFSGGAGARVAVLVIPAVLFAAGALVRVQAATQSDPVAPTANAATAIPLRVPAVPGLPATPGVPSNGSGRMPEA